MKSICENVSSLDGIRWVCSTNFGSYAASTQDFNGCAEKKNAMYPAMTWTILNVFDFFGFILNYFGFIMKPSSLMVCLYMAYSNLKLYSTKHIPP